MAAQPMRLRATLGADGVTEVRILVRHENENGRRKEADGRTVPAHYLTELEARVGERLVLRAELGTSISRNPLFTFWFEGGAAGETLSVRWTDNLGESRADSVKVESAAA